VRPARVLAAKLGLDGHDRGIRLIARELLTRGAEVVYLGIGTSPQQAAAAAVQEDVDVVAVSLLSGAHLAHVTRLVEELDRLDDPPPVVCGGLIPSADAAQLTELGDVWVMPVGTTVPAAAQAILDAASRATGAR
jgi:methylmalonyl-CoA mutase cobalamin-binding domain/chain